MSSDEESEFPTQFVWTVYLLICLSVIGGAINLYQLLRFINLKKERFLSSRRPTLIIVYCAISLSISIICTPLLFYAEALAPNGEDKEWLEYSIELVEELLTIILLSIVLLRTWLLFFDYNFVTATIDQNWRGIINPNEHNFWLNSRKTWGNTQYMMIVCSVIDIVFLVGLIIIAIETAMNNRGNALFHYFTIYGLGIPFAIIMLIILYKIDQQKNIEDTFYIQKEIKYLTGTIIFRIMGLCINTVFVSHDKHMWHLWFFCVEVICRFLFVYIQSWWVLNKLKQDNKSESLSFITIDKNTPKQSISKTMNEVFTHEDGIGLLTFIRHCVNEMSVENILFVIEICQYKHTVSESVSDLSDVEHGQFINVFSPNVVIVSSETLSVYKEFCAFISQQQRVPRRVNDDKENKSDWIYEYAQYLYRKYVDIETDLAVNISSSVRSNLSDVFRFNSFEAFVDGTDSHKTESDMEKLRRGSYLYHVFDCVFDEVWGLMKRDTFRRFKGTEEYRKIMAQRATQKTEESDV